MSQIRYTKDITYQVEGVLNWRLVVHWSEEVVLDTEDGKLFEESVTHQELLGGTRDVSVTVLQSHSSESGLLYLESNASSQVEVDLSLLGWMNTRVHGGRENVEAFVPDFVDHIE